MMRRRRMSQTALLSRLEILLYFATTLEAVLFHVSSHCYLTLSPHHNWVPFFQAHLTTEYLISLAHAQLTTGYLKTLAHAQLATRYLISRIRSPQYWIPSSHSHAHLTRYYLHLPHPLAALMAYVSSLLDTFTRAKGGRDESEFLFSEMRN